MNDAAGLVAQLKDGDALLVRSTRSLLGKLTVLVTRSPYTHAAVVVVIDGVPWVAEMKSDGNHLVPLARYFDADCDVFAFPGAADLVRRNTLDSLNGSIAYDFMELLEIAAFNLAHFQLPRTNQGGMVCSSYAKWLWLSSGLQLSGPSVDSPGGFAASIGAPPKLSWRDGAWQTT